MRTLPHAALMLAAVLVMSCGPAAPVHPLVQAIRSRDTADLEKLLSDGADANTVVDEQGHTALHVACGRGCKPAAVAVLLKYGADPTKVDRSGKTPWDIAFGNRSFWTNAEEAALRNLLQGGFKPDLTLDSSRQTLLHRLARRASETGLLTLAIQKLGLEVDARDDHGWTSLHVASYHGHANGCAELLALGADVNAETTKTVEDVSDDIEDEFVRMRVMAGSRPLDAHRYRRGGRGARSAASVLKEHGGTKNPTVKNVLR